MKISLSYIFFLFSYFVHAQEPDLFSLSNTEKYADYLYNTGNYSLAIPEYNRLIYFKGNVDEYTYRLIRCYRYNHNFTLALGQMDKLYTDIKLMPQSIANEYIYCNILTKNYDYTLKLLSDPGVTNVTNVSFYLGLTFILMGDYNRADEVLSQNPLKLEPNIRLQHSLKNYSEGKFKKPYLAITMSSIIPGSGKVYTGDWKDGLIAFSFVTISAWQSYRGFNKKGINSVYGWIYGIVSISFYIGNLYGSGKAANLYNIRKREIFQQNAQNIFINYID